MPRVMQALTTHRMRRRQTRRVRASAHHGERTLTPRADGSGSPAVGAGAYRAGGRARHRPKWTEPGHEPGDIDDAATGRRAWRGRPTTQPAHTDQLEMVRRVPRRHDHHPAPRRPQLTSTVSPELSCPPRPHNGSRRKTTRPSQLPRSRVRNATHDRSQPSGPARPLKIASPTPNAAPLDPQRQLACRLTRTRSRLVHLQLLRTVPSPHGLGPL